MIMRKYILSLILIICLVFSLNVSVTAWDVSTATYADKYKDVSSQDAYPYGVAFSSDGSKMYIAGYWNEAVFQYTLSASWDVSTATYANKSKYYGSQDHYACRATFSSDGSKMYIMGSITDTVFQYTLSTFWDVSAATYADKFKDIGDEEDASRGLTFSSDGSKMYVVGINNDTVFQYTLSILWDVSAATYANKFKDVSSEDDTPYGVAFSFDGNAMYVLGYTADTVFQYALSTSWDVSTAVYADKFKDVGSEDIYPFDITFSTDGSKMYIMGDNNDTVYQYTLPVGWSHKWNTEEISKWNTIEFIKWNGLE